jgi:hypothetical protein
MPDEQSKQVQGEAPNKEPKAHPATTADFL